MDNSVSQKKIRDLIFNQSVDEITVSISDSELNVVIEADGHDAAYTADEARDLATNILSVHHQQGWGQNIELTADYICDFADVADNNLSSEEVKQKWNHDGEVGSGLQYTIADELGKPIMSFESKMEAMRFCAGWNQRPSWTIEYRLETNGERVAVWNLTESEGAVLADHLEAEISRLICSEDFPDWDIVVEYQSEVPTENGSERICTVGVRNADNHNVRHRYQMYYSEHGGGVNVLTQHSGDYGRRVRIDRQRGRILEAMSTIPKRFGLYFGPPEADLELMDLGDELSPDHDFP